MHQLFVILAVPAFFALIWYRHWKNDWLNREIREGFREFAKIVASIDFNRLIEIAGETSPPNPILIEILSEKTKA
jgi:hypothetical protein